MPHANAYSYSNNIQRKNPPLCTSDQPPKAETCLPAPPDTHDTRCCNSRRTLIGTTARTQAKLQPIPRVSSRTMRSGCKKIQRRSRKNMRIRPNCDLVARPKIEAISGSRWQMRLCGGGDTVAGGGNLDGNATPEPVRRRGVVKVNHRPLRVAP